MYLVRSDSDVSGCESELKSFLLADIIACRYAVLICHGFHYLTQIENVRREVRRSGPKNVCVGCAEASRRAVVRLLLAKVKLVCLVVAMR